MQYTSRRTILSYTLAKVSKKLTSLWVKSTTALTV